MGCITSAPESTSDLKTTEVPRKYEFEYSVSPAIVDNTREIAPPSTMSRQMSEDIPASECESEHHDFQSLAQGLERKITVLSQNSLLIDCEGDNSEEETDGAQKVDICEIVATCREILELADCREQEIRELAVKRDDAEQRAIAYLEANQKWKQTLAVSKRHCNQIRAEKEALSVKLEYHIQKLQSTEQQLIESKAQNVSTQQTIEQTETKMQQMMAEKLEFEASMNMKLQIIEKKSKQKNQALQALVKKNNAYLVETHSKMKAVRQENQQLTANCTNWKDLCQQQATIIQKLQIRQSSSAVAKIDEYLQSQKALMTSLESSMLNE